MASSRIFVRGLPPTYSEEEFKKHFAKQLSITDAKLLPHRRIGYVGYKTPDDAAKAVKYFNKSFIRMSKIGVELALPIDHESLPRPRRADPRDTANHRQQNTADHGIVADSNSLKRKRGAPNEIEPDSKLKEFLEVMQPPSKPKTWTNEASSTTAPTAVGSEDFTEPVVVPAGDSDIEYEAVPKKTKRLVPPTIRPSAAEEATDLGHEDRGKSGTNKGEASLPQDVIADEHDRQDTQPEGQPLTDADWLRSRTSRLLGLVDDRNEEVANRDTARASDQGAVTTEQIQVVPDPVETHAIVDVEDEQQPENTSEAFKGKTNAQAIEDSSRLFLRNLPYGITESEIREHFGSFGELQEARAFLIRVHVPMDPHSGTAKGFAYVHYTDPEHAVQAYQDMDGKIVQGRLMHILPAASKRESRLDDFAMSKLPLKKQKQIQRKRDAATTIFNWNALYMNNDAVMSSISDRLGVAKSELLDPTSSDAAVKQAHAETHIVQETKAYFANNGIDLNAFKKHERGDTGILVKNFPYGTNVDELRKMFEEHGQVSKVLMPPTGTIAIVEFAQAPQARAAFAALAYRKVKDSVLFLEKAPKDLFQKGTNPAGDVVTTAAPEGSAPKLSTTDLLQEQPPHETVDTSTLFVRNLNFSTTTERLTEVFKPLDGFLSARVKTKSDLKKPGQVLSMGFGFLEFRSKQQAQAALSAMNGYNLEGHKLLVKTSHKALDAAEERRKEDKARKVAGKRTKIIIKNLPFETSKKDVRALFGSYGQLRSVRVPKKFDKGARGFAFADFTTPREAENAMDALRDTHLLGRRLVLDFAAEDPEDAEAEIEKMQKKVGSQINKVALQRLTSSGRKKFNVEGNNDLDAI
ncbi:hypothetical protein B0A49_05815 [Cryomyces minteri]|uniref:Multiple RNA-binding domain-containing protein 1 n=1 Tax=Cryomyces minteri TaxID=331657 RepID=A0A4U0WUD6_9PEZI|nr:hypothetical protein B0A49_05815 [Cryomyces minteri]